MAGKNSGQKKDIPAIEAVTPLDRYRLYIRFGSGSILELNMANRLHTNRYYDLGNEAVFRSAITDGIKISFDTGAGYQLEIFARETLDRAIRDPDGSMGILHIQPLAKARLRLEMKNGSVLILNMANWLKTIRYSSLKEPEALQSVTTDGENLFFGDALKIDKEELINLALTVPPAGKEAEAI